MKYLYSTKRTPFCPTMNHIDLTGFVNVRCILMLHGSVLFLSVSKPAPDWNGTAVINGEFKDIKLSDYRGKYLVFFFYPLDLYV